jgi:hypothetical protein
VASVLDRIRLVQTVDRLAGPRPGEKVFTGEGSLVNLATVVMLRATEDWAFRRYLDIDPLWATEEKPTKIAI